MKGNIWKTIIGGLQMNLFIWVDYMSTKLSELKYANFGRLHYSVKLMKQVYSINLLGFSVYFICLWVHLIRKSMKRNNFVFVLDYNIHYKPSPASLFPLFRLIRHTNAASHRLKQTFQWQKQLYLYLLHLFMWLVCHTSYCYSYTAIFNMLLMWQCVFGRWPFLKKCCEL